MSADTEARVEAAQRREVVVDGHRVSYRRVAAGARSTGRGVPLLLVHGGGAHAGWWNEVVPLLAGGFDLLIPDLGGHGDSEHRDDYSLSSWAWELAAVLRHEGVPRARVVGHSMGGVIGMTLAAELPATVASLVMIDTRLRPPDGPKAAVPRGRGWHPTAVHPTRQEALERFQLPPTGSTAPPEVLHRVASEGLRRVEGGWTWRFDPRVSRRFTDEMVDAVIPQVRCEVAYLRGADSAVSSPAAVTYLQERLGRPVTLVEIPGARHHVPLDQPAACADAIREVLGATTPADLPEPPSSDIS